MDIYSELKNRLVAHLNFYKLVDGDDYRDGQLDPASENFYNNVIPNEILKQLGDIEGAVFPEWGTKHNGEIYGGRYNGQWITPTIRWARDRNSWEEARNNGEKQIRTRVNGVDEIQHKPQIVVALKDPALYDFFREAKDHDGNFLFTSRSGGRSKDGKNRKFNKKLRENELFKNCEIEPLSVIIRSISKQNKEEEISKFLPLNKSGDIDDSMILRRDLGDHHISMFHLDSLNSMDEQVRLQNIEKMGRQALLHWGLQ